MTELQDIKAEIAITKRKLDAAKTIAEVRDREEKILSLRNLLSSQTNSLTRLMNIKSSGGLAQFELTDEMIAEMRRDDDFPNSDLGGVTWPRKDAINMALGDIKKQQNDPDRQDYAASLYVCGSKGTGKSNFLILLLRDKLKHKVYFLDQAGLLDKLTQADVEAALNEHGQVALVIDEVYNSPNNIMWLPLLRLINNHKLIVIGAAVPTMPLPSLGAQFYHNWSNSKLLLSEGDSDMHCLIEHWIAKLAKDVDNNPGLHMVKSICDRIREHCGGHMFPVVKFVEHMFTNEAAKLHLTDMAKFENYLCGESFAESDVSETVYKRCFDVVDMSQMVSMCSRVLCGRPMDKDVDELTRLGMWNQRTLNIMSPLLYDIILNGITGSLAKDELVKYDSTLTPAQNIEAVLIAGLQCLRKYDFTDFQRQVGVRLEDGVTFSWVAYLKQQCVVYLSAKTREGEGRVDFQLNNGRFRALVKVFVDAVGSGDGQNNINTETQQMHNNKHHEEGTTVYLNFRTNVTTTRNMHVITTHSHVHSPYIVLPEDEKLHEVVFTFDKDHNTLYQGEVPIMSPVSEYLPVTGPVVEYKPPSVRGTYAIMKAAYDAAKLATLRKQRRRYIKREEKKIHCKRFLTGISGGRSFSSLSGANQLINCLVYPTTCTAVDLRCAPWSFSAPYAPLVGASANAGATAPRGVHMSLLPQKSCQPAFRYVKTLLRRLLF